MPSSRKIADENRGVAGSAFSGKMENLLPRLPNVKGRKSETEGPLNNAVNVHDDVFANSTPVKPIHWELKALVDENDTVTGEITVEGDEIFTEQFSDNSTDTEWLGNTPSETCRNCTIGRPPNISLFASSSETDLQQTPSIADEGRRVGVPEGEYEGGRVGRALGT